MEDLRVAIKGMYKTIKFPQVWKSSLYMYLAYALNISTHEVEKKDREKEREGEKYWAIDW